MHWFCLRKLNGVWYDLNSTNKFPEILDESRMQEFLDNSVSFEYMLFKVRGQFPKKKRSDFKDHEKGMQVWFKESFLKLINDQDKLSSMQPTPPSQSSSPQKGENKHNSASNDDQIKTDEMIALAMMGLDPSGANKGKPAGGSGGSAGVGGM
mmetsp:Transcript_17496/g.15355  ORF Transcript_17496/g.15355 Transcript_17496/m.15355 type:complete len:152 (+) Transcript_17496:477-932(+)